MSWALQHVHFRLTVVRLPVKVMLSCLPSFVSTLLDLASKLPFFVINLLLTALEPARGHASMHEQEGLRLLISDMWTCISSCLNDIMSQAWGKQCEKTAKALPAMQMCTSQCNRTCMLVTTGLQRHELYTKIPIIVMFSCVGKLPLLVNHPLLTVLEPTAAQALYSMRN